MTVIPEDTLLDFFENCLSLSNRALNEFRDAEADRPASPELVKDYAELIQRLHSEKRHDSILADETWEWIWRANADMKAIQIYGRLAWMNYNLVDLL